MHASEQAGTKRYPLMVNHLVAILLYLGAAGIGLEMVPWREQAPLIWPPAGLGLVFLLSGRRYLLPVILLGAFAARLWGGGQIPEALVFGVAYAFLAWATATILRRYLNFSNSLERIRDVTAFLVVAVVGMPLLCALLTTGALFTFSGQFLPDFWTLFYFRWLGDALGTLVVAPFLLVWYSRTQINWRNEQAVEVFVWLSTLIFLGALVFRNWAPVDTLQYPLELAVFPVMAWASIRFGQRGVSVGILVVAIVAVWELGEVIGPGATRTITQHPGYLWVYVGIIASTSLYLAATWTELRNREDELRTNEERLRAFVHAMPDLALVFQENGVCSEIFAPVGSEFRERISAFKNKSLESIYPPDLARKFRETIDEVVHNRDLAILRYAISVDGRDRVYEGRFAPIESAGQHAPAVMVVSYDLTESQLARHDLQKRDMLLKALTEAEGILLREKNYHRGLRRAIECIGKGVGLDMVQVYRIHANLPQDEMLDCTHEWLRDHPFMFGRHKVQAGDFERISPLWREFLEKGSPWEMHFSEANEETISFLNQLGMRSVTIIGIRPQGGEMEFVLFGSSLERSGRDQHASSVIQAISKSLRAYTETQMIQEQLERAKEAAIAADNAKGEFLAIMSHEIRTPMNAIIGFSDLLNQTQMNEQQQDYVDIILRSGKDLLDLINNILDFSKLESNKMEMERVRFSLETTIMESMEMVLFRAREKGIKMSFHGHEDVQGYYWGDPLRLRQVLLNLLTNAVKFTHEGEVRLEAELQERDEAWATFEFRVIDTGIGIPEKNRSELFRAFSQVDTSTTREYGGTGLGLSIVQKLVSKMGGRVSLESRVGEGSTFSVVLRLERDPSDEELVYNKQEDHLDKSFASEHPLQVLVVEDDAVNERLICEILKRLGYSPDSVPDGYKALAALTEDRHNVVLMDMQMSRLDGLETVRRIRSGECGDRAQGISVIAMTALALQEERERILSGGVDYYISKPLQLGNLKHILEEVSTRISGK